MPGDVVGTAYVTIRALTAGIAKDIEDGVKKGAADADTESAGKAAGADFAKGYGKGTEKSVSKQVEKSVSKSSGDSGVQNASNKVGRSIFKNILDGLGKDKKKINTVFKDIGHTALSAFQFPKGKLDWIGVLGVPMLGGAVQVAMASLGTLTAALGQLVFASAGAGVAVGGMFAALGVGVLPIILAFKSSGAAAEEFKAAMSGLTKPFQEIGEATINTLGPGLLAAVENFKKFIPLMSQFGSGQGEIVGNMAHVTSAILTSTESMGLWREGLGRVQTVFKNLTPGVAGLASALPTLFASTMPIAQRFSESLGKMGKEFGDFIRETGKGDLTKTFQGWYEAAAQVFRTLGNVALGLMRILKIGAEDSGQSMFDKFEEFSQKFDNWTKSVKGNTAITDFFRRSRDVMGAVGDILGDIGKALFGPIKGAASSTSVIGTLDSIREKWIPPLTQIIEQIRTAGQLSFDNIIDEIGRFLDILAENPQLVSTALSSLSINMGVFTAALKILNTVLGSGVGKKLFEFLGPLIPLVVLANKMKIGKLAKDLFGLAKSLDVKIAARGAAPALQNVQGQLQGMGDEMDNTKKKGGAFQTAMGVMAAGVGGFMAGMAKDAKGAVAGIGVSLAGIGMAFATGGWVGAGVAAVTAGVGFIVGRWKRGQEEAKAAAKATEAMYREIGESQKRALQGAFDEVGTTALSRRSEVGLKAFKTMLSDNTKGADTFARAFGVSMEQTAQAMEKPIKEFSKWTEEVRHNRIADVLRGDKQAWAVWGDDAKAAGEKVAKFMNANHTSMLEATAATGVYSDKSAAALESLGKQLASGAISWDEYVAAAKKAGVSTQELARGTTMMKKEINAAMLASESGAFLKKLPADLQAAGAKWTAEMRVEQAWIDHQEAMKPAAQKQVEALGEVKKRVDEVAEAYYQAKFAAEDFAAQQAGGMLGIAENLKQQFGAPKEGQEGLDMSLLENQFKVQQLTAESGKSFSTLLSNQVQQIAKVGGSYQDLLDWQTETRNNMKLMLTQAGVPMSPAIIEQINKVTDIDPEVVATIDIRNEVNGVPKTVEQATEEQGKFNNILKMSGKEYTTELANFTKANGKLTPLQQQQVTMRQFNRDLAGLNGTEALTNARHFVYENTKGMSQEEVNKWAGNLGVTLRDVDKTKAATKTAHDVAENTKKKATKNIISEARDMQTKLQNLDKTHAGTSTTQGSKENNVPRPMPLISEGAWGLWGALGNLGGTNAASSSNTSIQENGVQKASSEITANLGGIVTKLETLNGKTFRTTYLLNTIATVNMATGQAPGGRFDLGGGVPQAEGGYFNKATSVIVGEAGAEIILPITDQKRSMQLLTKFAPGLMGSKLDRMVLGPGGSSTSGTTGSVTGLNIENATFQSGTDADLVAARIRSSLRTMGVT
jgi:hypothetical protein